MAVGTLDYYVHEIVIMLEVYRGTRPETSTFLRSSLESVRQAVSTPTSELVRK